MSKYQEAFNNFKMLMGDSKQFTKVQNLVVLVHTINRSNNLKCIDGNQQFQFPINWRTPEEGVYSFTYRNTTNNKMLKFRCSQKDNKLEVIFNRVNSSQSYRTLLKLDDSDDQNARTYDFNLQQYLKDSQKMDRPREFQRDKNQKQINAPIQNVYSHQIGNQGVGVYPPKNLINPPQSISNPFGQEEYVGPNSLIFNGPTNPYENIQPYPGSLRIPPGSRYDPIDPFDNPNRVNPQGPEEFYGFDEFGRPKKAPFGGMNSQGGRGGLGGGFRGGFGGSFGGGFGGTGGGFGPNFGI